MDRLRLEELRRNAYRVLGLPAGATQAEVHAAARMMLLVAQNTEGAGPDGDWLGPIDRRPAEIEGAVMRLADPRERLWERAWWFWGSVPANREEAERMRAAPEGPQRNEVVDHDGLVVDLVFQLQSEGNAELQSWEQTLAVAVCLAGEEKSKEWLARAEAEGDFEKRATEGEIAAAHVAMAEQAAMTLAHVGDDVLGCDDLESLASVLEMLDGAEAFGATSAEWLMDRMDEMLAARCDAGRVAVEAACSRGICDEVTEACREVMRSFDAHDERLMGMLMERLGEGDRRERVCCVMAGNLEFIAGVLERAGDRWGALKVLEKALKVAEGTALEERIRSKHDKLNRELNWNSSFVFGKAFEVPGPKAATQGKTVSMTIGTDGIVTTGDRLSTNRTPRKVEGSKRAAAMIAQARLATAQNTQRAGNWAKRARERSQERHGARKALVGFVCLMLSMTVGLVFLHQGVTQSPKPESGVQINWGDSRYGLPFPPSTQSSWPFLPGEVRPRTRPGTEGRLSLDPTSIPGLQDPRPLWITPSATQPLTPPPQPRIEAPYLLPKPPLPPGR